MSQNASLANAQVPQELRCTYRSKPCPNERARKRNGSLHMLCQEHRLKANKTQRDMQRRLREQRRQQQLNNQLWSPVTIQRMDRVLLEDMPELDTDDDLDWWATAEPLDGPVELRPEDIEALLELWDTTMHV
ncbi:hypothetical protein BBJ28_00017136 [Nothophytophthora sp. Chile5]|nr:hypothetical protein BBJ28_00017136 [Nothophytophthora sp. Chile5]